MNTHKYEHRHTQTHTYEHTHTHTYEHTHAHTYEHTHTRGNFPSSSTSSHQHIYCCYRAPPPWPRPMPIQCSLPGAKAALYLSIYLRGVATLIMAAPPCLKCTVRLITLPTRVCQGDSPFLIDTRGLSPYAHTHTYTQTHRHTDTHTDTHTQTHTHSHAGDSI